MKTYYGIMPVQAGKIAKVKIIYVGWSLQTTYLLTLTNGEVHRYKGKRPNPGDWLLMYSGGSMDRCDDATFKAKFYAHDPGDTATFMEQERDELAKELNKIRDKVGVTETLRGTIDAQAKQLERAAESFALTAKRNIELQEALKQANDRLNTEMAANRFLRNKAKELAMKLSVFVRMKDFVFDNGSKLVVDTATAHEPDALDKIDEELTSFNAELDTAVEKGRRLVAESQPTEEDKAKMAELMAEAKQKVVEILDESAKNFQPPTWEETVHLINHLGMPPIDKISRDQRVTFWDPNKPLEPPVEVTPGKIYQGEPENLNFQNIPPEGIVFGLTPIDDAIVQEGRAQLEKTKARLRAISGPRQPMIGDLVVYLGTRCVFTVPAIMTSVSRSDTKLGEMMVIQKSGIWVCKQATKITPGCNDPNESAYPGPRWCYPAELEAVTAMLNDASKNEAD